jgi:hypothetical protein
LAAPQWGRGQFQVPFPGALSAWASKFFLESIFFDSDTSQTAFDPSSPTDAEPARSA